MQTPKKRTRSKIKAGRPGTRTGLRYTLQDVDDYTSAWETTGGLFVPSEPAALFSRMTDNEIRDLNMVSQPCLHHKVTTVIGGDAGPPDFSQAGRENAMRYMSFYVTGAGIPTRLEGVPTMCLLPYATSVFPGIYQTEFDYRELLRKKWGWPEWSREGWKRPKITLTSDFNLLNFLIELKQSVKLVASWIAKEGLLRRYHAIAGVNASLRGRAKALADERLAHVYGTKLFMADARSLFNLIVGWKNRADRFLAEAGLVQHKHKLPVRVEYSLPSQYSSFPVFGVSTSTIEYWQQVTMEAHAEMYYKYSAPEIRGFLARLGQLSDTFGVKFDAGVAWDAIPYTFCVDWFINVGEWLHANWSKDWTKLDFALVDFTTSGKVVWTKGVDWTTYHRSDRYNTSSRRLITREITYYDRHQEEPPEFKSVDLEIKGDPWKVNRIVNAVALSAQKGLRKPAETPLWFNYRGSQRKKARQFRTKFRLM